MKRIMYSVVSISYRCIEFLTSMKSLENALVVIPVVAPRTELYIFVEQAYLTEQERTLLFKMHQSLKIATKGLQQSVQNLHNFITHFFSRGFSTQIGRPKSITTQFWVIEDFFNSFLNSLCRLFQSQRVAEEHRSTENGANWVCDSFASYIGRGAMNRFVQTVGWYKVCRRQGRCTS